MIYDVRLLPKIAERYAFVSYASERSICRYLPYWVVK